jgi:5-methylcytosine-specific restriction endonuclease McrA
MAFYRQLRTVGVDEETALQMAEAYWERREPEIIAQRHKAMRAAFIADVRRLAPRRLYARSPRTKAYGPRVAPETYWSAEKRRAYDYALSTRPLDVPVARLSDKEWWPLVGAVLRRDGHTCTYCGARDDTYILHCDHIIPVSRGGQNVIENLTTACEWCNCSKRDTLPHEWRSIPGGPQ